MGALTCALAQRLPACLRGFGFSSSFCTELIALVPINRDRAQHVLPHLAHIYFVVLSCSDASPDDVKLFLRSKGQRGSTRVKGYPAPVFLWDYATRASLFVFQGLAEVRVVDGASLQYNL